MRKDATPTKIDLILDNTVITSVLNISSLQAIKTVDRTGFVIQVNKSLLPSPGNVIF